jgi:DNA-directed RNA polymerase subunit RPC12/RpoP
MWVHDRLVKIKCHSCGDEFLVSEYVLQKKTDKEYPGDGCYCPYCGSTETVGVTWTGDDPGRMDFVEEMGCLAISHHEIGEGEELRLFRLHHEGTGKEAGIMALNFVHAIELFRKSGNWEPGRITWEQVDLD